MSEDLSVRQTIIIENVGHLLDDVQNKTVIQV